MKYTIDDYKKVCYAAGELSQAIETLRETQYDLANNHGWSDFGKCLAAVYDALDEYNRVNNQCAIDAYDREDNYEN